MSYLDTIQNIGTDAETLEVTYQDALEAGDNAAFAEAINTSFGEHPDNLLYAAWYYRLAHTLADTTKAWAPAWKYAIPLAILNGLIFWFLSDYDRFIIELTNPATGRSQDFVPTLAILIGPIVAAMIIIYLLLAGKRHWQRALMIILGLAIAAVYALLVYAQAGPLPFQRQYLTLMTIHLPLLAWGGIGIYLLARHRDANNRFAFLIKSLEVLIMGGLFVIAGGIFVGITVGLFDALGIQLDDLLMRLLIAGGGGLIPVLATAVIYNPNASPAQQSFDEGLSKLIALLMRALLPLTLLVLAIYLVFIPFNFREPFENRDVLIIYNAMLFAVMVLLVGATPVSGTGLSASLQRWLRRGIITVTTLALIVSLYALAAISYRTAVDTWTPNRFTFIGWNVINISILALLLIKQVRAGQGGWIRRLHETFATGAIAYLFWVLVVIFTTPWLFGLDQQNIQALPQQVQRILYEDTYPILLKCSGSPHIYLLKDGEKHWVKDIPTFEAQGFEWRDVERISCDNLDAVPVGVPIPPDAGEPPEPKPPNPSRLTLLSGNRNLSRMTASQRGERNQHPKMVFTAQPWFGKRGKSLSL